MKITVRDVPFQVKAKLTEMAAKRHSETGMRTSQNYIYVLALAEYAGVKYCPHCGGFDVSRFQWVDNAYFEYWTCWACDYSFITGR